MTHRTVILASPCGFCAGVRYAVEMADAALRLRPTPLYALNEIVHNPHVVRSFEAKGVRFVRRVEDVPEGHTVLFSAHGVSPAVRAAAAARHLDVIDATCPFVHKVHAEVARYAREGYGIALIGHRGHEEVLGVAGEAPEQVVVLETEEEAEAYQPHDSTRVAVAMQTTLSAEEAERVYATLRRRFPGLRSSPVADICYATTNRQAAVKALAARVRTILVLGARNSSNTRRLAEVARAAGASAILISQSEELSETDLEGLDAVGLTAGASTPGSFIGEVLDLLRAQGFDRVDTLETTPEDIRFVLPAALRAK